jgi:hypothetical protein
MAGYAVTEDDELVVVKVSGSEAVGAWLRANRLVPDYLHQRLTAHVARPHTGPQIRVDCFLKRVWRPRRS